MNLSPLEDRNLDVESQFSFFGGDDDVLTLTDAFSFHEVSSWNDEDAPSDGDAMHGARNLDHDEYATVTEYTRTASGEEDSQAGAACASSDLDTTNQYSYRPTAPSGGGRNNMYQSCDNDGNFGVDLGLNASTPRGRDPPGDGAQLYDSHANPSQPAPRRPTAQQPLQLPTPLPATAHAFAAPQQQEETAVNHANHHSGDDAVEPPSISAAAPSFQSFATPPLDAQRSTHLDTTQPPQPPPPAAAATADQETPWFPAQDVLLGYSGLRHFMQHGNLVMKNVANSKGFPRRVKHATPQELQTIKRMQNQAVQIHLQNDMYKESTFWIHAGKVDTEQKIRKWTKDGSVLRRFIIGNKAAGTEVIIDCYEASDAYIGEYHYKNGLGRDRKPSEELSTSKPTNAGKKRKPAEAGNAKVSALLQSGEGQVARTCNSMTSVSESHEGPAETYTAVREKLHKAASQWADGTSNLKYHSFVRFETDLQILDSWRTSTTYPNPYLDKSQIQEHDAMHRIQLENLLAKLVKVRFNEMQARVPNQANSLADPFSRGGPGGDGDGGSGPHTGGPSSFSDGSHRPDREFGGGANGEHSKPSAGSPPDGHDSPTNGMFGNQISEWSTPLGRVNVHDNDQPSVSSHFPSVSTEFDSDSSHTTLTTGSSIQDDNENENPSAAFPHDTGNPVEVDVERRPHNRMVSDPHADVLLVKSSMDRNESDGGAAVDARTGSDPMEDAPKRRVVSSTPTKILPLASEAGKHEDTPRNSSPDDDSSFARMNNRPTPDISDLYLGKTFDLPTISNYLESHKNTSSDHDGFNRDGEESKQSLNDPFPSCFDSGLAAGSAVVAATLTMKGDNEKASEDIGAVEESKLSSRQSKSFCASLQSSDYPSRNDHHHYDNSSDESMYPPSDSVTRSIEFLGDVKEQHSSMEQTTPWANGDDCSIPLSVDSFNQHQGRMSSFTNSQQSLGSTTVPTKPGAYDVLKVTPAGSVTYEVVAPPECLSGDAFDVQAGNRTAEVIVPLDYEPGEQLEITLPPDSITTFKPLKVALLTASPAAEKAWKKQSIHCRQKSRSIGGAIPMSGPIKEINEAAMQAGKSVARTHIVTIPKGIGPGQTFQASGDGFTFAVKCPASNIPGDRIRIVPPPPPPEPTKAMQYFRVQVPAGVQPGDQFAATIDTTHERLEVLVECPEGRAGKTITVGLPTQTVVGKIALSYESHKLSGWRRTVRASDLHFQWVRLLKNKSSTQSSPTEAIHSFDFFKSAYVRQIVQLEGHDPRLSTASIRLVPAGEAVTASKLRLGGKTIISYADLAMQQVQSLANKHKWFINMCQELTSLHNLAKPPNPDDVVNDTYVEIFVRRDRLLRDSLRAVQSLSVAQMRANWRIHWIGEPAFDDGGLTKEWFDLVTKELLSPATGLFVGCNESNQAVVDINPASGSPCRGVQLMYYRFAGRVLGRALFSNHQINGHLARTLHKHILGWPITYEDICDQDEELYMSLKKLAKENDLSNLELCFTMTENINGEYVNIELVEGGADIEVTNENLSEYLEAILRYKLFDRTLPQLTELLLGFYDIIPEPALTVFDAGELELLLCGMPNIDVEDWKMHTEYGGHFQSSGLSNFMVQWFWQLVEEDFDTEMRARLLQFVTGTSSVPPSGFAALRGKCGELQRFNLHGVDRQSCFYPKAHTCFNRIDCPIYSSKEELRERLMVAIMTSFVGFDVE